VFEKKKKRKKEKEKSTHLVNGSISRYIKLENFKKANS